MQDLGVLGQNTGLQINKPDGSRSGFVFNKAQHSSLFLL